MSMPDFFESNILGLYLRNCRIQKLNQKIIQKIKIKKINKVIKIKK